MAVGLYSGVSGLALGVGLYKGNSGLWGGSSGLINGFGGSGPFPGASLYLDFLTPPLDSRITFSRGSNATLVDATGKITYAPANLLTYSEQFDNAAWVNSIGGTGTNPTISANTGVAPDGTSTADRLQFSLGGGTTLTDLTRRIQNYNTLAGTTYTFSVYLRSFDGSSTYNMHLVAADGVTTSIVVTGAWQRITVTGSRASTAIVGYAIGIRGGLSPANSNTADVLAWGAQLEQVTYQTTPSTYVATTASAYYGPRFDYDPVTLAPKGLLIEEARTNLLTYSEQFDNAVWTKTNATVAANATASPDGTVDADKLIPSTSLSQHRIDFTTSAAAGTYAFSTYIKAAGYNFAWFRIGLNGGWVDLTNGSVSGVTGGYTLTATPAGNGWYRLVLVGAAALNDTVRINVAQVNLTSDFTGDGTSGLYLYGAQLEAGSFATSYIPTVASTVTRSADVAQMTGTNFSSWYNASAGSLFVSATGYNAPTAPQGSTSPTAASLYAAAAGNSFAAIAIVRRDSVATSVLNSPTAYVISDTGVTGIDIQQSSVSWVGATVGAAFAWNGSTDAAFTANGAAVVTDTSYTLPTSDSLQIGRWGSEGVTGYWSGHIRTIAYFNTRLPNAQLQTLTAPSLATTLSLDFTSGSYNVGF